MDEYGAVVGIATMEDVLEEIVGEIREEHETASGVLVRLSDGNYVTDGDASIREAAAALGLAPPDTGGYQTVAGLILHTLGRIPTPGTAIPLGGYRWTVLEMEGPRITRVRIERDERRRDPAGPTAARSVLSRRLRLGAQRALARMDDVEAAAAAARRRGPRWR